MVSVNSRKMTSVFMCCRQEKMEDLGEKAGVRSWCQGEGSVLVPREGLALDRTMGSQHTDGTQPKAPTASMHMKNSPCFPKNSFRILSKQVPIGHK